MNSFIYTVLGVTINIVMTVAIAYPLSKSTFVGRNVIMMILVFTILFSGGLIPTYLTVKAVGILDTRWAMLLPGALAVFQVIVARTFFQSTIPKELGEAAELDGCSDIGFLWRVVLPLSKAILAVLILFYAVGNWNAYFDALIYLKSPELYPLQIILRNILILNSIDASSLVDANQMAARQGLRDLLKFSLIVVATVPILCIYPFVQKFFVQGIMIGSIKG
jgi:putative aldouronate transport system permease protein